MQIVKTDILFLNTICLWLSDNQNFIDCGGKSGATWFEVFNTVSKFWEVGTVYKIIGENAAIGFLFIEGDTFHTFLLPQHRNAHNGHNLYTMTFSLMFDILGKKKIYTLTNIETAQKYLIRKGFIRNGTRYNYSKFALTEQEFLKCP